VGFFVDVIVGYIARSIRNGWRAGSSGDWPLVEAIVTAAPTTSSGYGGTTVEIPYSYRVRGELYTGLHEEPCSLFGSEYMKRFPKGKRFVVRIKPEEPEVSVMRDADQTDEIMNRLDRIDERHKRDVP
jgi:hypothetical protein